MTRQQKHGRRIPATSPKTHDFFFTYDSSSSGRGSCCTFNTVHTGIRYAKLWLLRIFFLTFARNIRKCFYTESVVCTGDRNPASYDNLTLWPEGSCCACGTVSQQYAKLRNWDFFGVFGRRVLHGTSTLVVFAFTRAPGRSACRAHAWYPRYRHTAVVVREAKNFEKKWLFWRAFGTTHKKTSFDTEITTNSSVGDRHRVSCI